MSSDAQEQPPTTGLVAGKYQLLRLIGRGGMGTVWEGRHASLGTRVAIKFIDVEYADSQEARTRFDNEARAAATIQSKHAIQIYDHGVSHDGKPYIVMELLTGEPLDQRIERLGRLTLQDTARILRQVARALGRAHERGIVHRDLKPENIFLVRTPDEDDEIAKVLDFGIAKFKRPEHTTGHGGISSSTKTGAVLGTPFYMSPEQARGLREVDHRTDMWSLGVIAFKCVAGVLPFEGVSVGDLLVKICTSPPPVPSHVVPGLPTSFDAWFARALDRDPARRFQSAQELSDALAYAAGLSIRRGASGGVHDGSFPPGAPRVPSGGVAPTRPMNEPPVSAVAGLTGTSAPFTASSRRASSGSRGLVVAIGAGVVGVALGYVAIAKFTGGKHSSNVTVVSGTANGPSTPTSALPTASVAIAAPQAAPSAPDAGVATVDLSGLSLTPPATTATNGAATPLGTSRTPRGVTGPRGGGANGKTGTTAPAATLPPPPVVTPPPPVKPAPTVIDPGY